MPPRRPATRDCQRSRADASAGLSRLLAGNEGVAGGSRVRTEAAVESALRLLVAGRSDPPSYATALRVYRVLSGLDWYGRLPASVRAACLAETAILVVNRAPLADRTAHLERWNDAADALAPVRSACRRRFP